MKQNQEKISQSEKRKIAQKNKHIDGLAVKHLAELLTRDGLGNFTTKGLAEKFDVNYTYINMIYRNEKGHYLKYKIWQYLNSIKTSYIMQKNKDKNYA